MALSVISLTEPFFLKVLVLLDRDARQSDDLARLQRDLMAYLQDIEQKAYSGAISLSEGEWSTVKRVLVYWADEVLTQHLPDWDDYTLEQSFFEEQNRAWKLYVEGENISTSNSEVAEIFYLAIVLGFEGDIEGAFRDELRVEMPGGHQDEATARRHWAMQLQRRVRHEAAGDLQGEPLIGDVSPLPSAGFHKAGLGAFLIALVLFLIVAGWRMSKRQEPGTTPSIDSQKNNAQVETGASLRICGSASV